MAPAGPAPPRPERRDARRLARVLLMDLLEALVRTEALRIAPPGEVFWYTSGTIGPYYIRTEFLYGGPEEAEDLLEFIDRQSRSPEFHAQLTQRVAARLTQDSAYAAVVDALAEAIAAATAAADVEWISGGERRDWFFSLAVAMRTGRPHLYLYKNGDAALAEDGAVTPVERMDRRRTAHVADLVTEASSYARAWIPAVRDRGGDMAVSANVVDRAQGGMEVIRAAGVDARALLRVDEQMFDALRERRLIDDDQHAMLAGYFRDPTAAMKRFLEQRPEFLQAALASEDERTAGRARLLVEQDLYGLASA